MASHSEKHIAEASSQSPSSDESLHDVKRNSRGIKLEPQPSDDPKDPLNWPMTKKAGILAILCLSAFAGTAQGGANVSGGRSIRSVSFLALC